MERTTALTLLIMSTWSWFVKVGDLVQYSYFFKRPSQPEVGIVIQVDHDHVHSPVPYKVRWTDHTDSERDWYREDELVKL